MTVISPEFVSRAVCLYYRFTLSLRDVQELMFERGVVVSHETIRQWCAMFGRSYANELRRRKPRPGNKWYLDEVFILINGRNDQNLWIPGGRTFPEDDLQGIENSDQDQRANAGGKVRPCSR